MDISVIFIAVSALIILVLMLTRSLKKDEPDGVIRSNRRARPGDELVFLPARETAEEPIAPEEREKQEAAEEAVPIES